MGHHVDLHSVTMAVMSGEKNGRFFECFQFSRFV